MDRLKLLVIGDPTSVHVVGRARLFAERGHQVELLSPRRAQVTPPPVLHHPLMEGDGWLAGGRRLTELIRLLHRLPADVIHVHYAANLTAWLLLLVGGGAPVVVSTMGGDILDDEQFPLPRLARWMTWRLLRRAHAVTAKTAHMVEVLVRNGVKPERIHLVPWGIDTRTFHPRDVTHLRTQLGVSENDRIILSPRLLRPFYNIHLLVEAFARVRAVHPTARLLLTEYGADPEYRRELSERIDALNLRGAVIWLGCCDQDRMAALYTLADVVVSLPPSDGLSQAVMEALACGAPCILTHMDRFDRLLGDKVMWTHLEAGAVTRALIEVLGNATLARRLSEGGPPLVDEHFDVARSRNTVEHLYRCLAGHRRPAEPAFVRLAIIIILAAWLARNGLRRLVGKRSPTAII